MIALIVLGAYLLGKIEWWLFRKLIKWGLILLLFDILILALRL